MPRLANEHLDDLEAYVPVLFEDEQIIKHDTVCLDRYRAVKRVKLLRQRDNASWQLVRLRDAVIAE